jgi:RNA polymerase sigma-70 factor (ECF subfamily)
MSMLRVVPRAAADAEKAPLDTGALYAEHVHRVARWAERLGGPDVDLEDVVHEVFGVVHQQRAKFRHESSVATWLFGITDNVVRHRRRKERWRRWLTGSAEDTAGHVASPAPDPLRQAERDEAARVVYRLLDRLPERDRQILILCELEELAADEVGTLLAIRPANARLRLHRARARFLRVYRQAEEADGRRERGLAHSKTV